MLLLVPEWRSRGVGTSVYQAREKWIGDQGGNEVRLAVAEPMRAAVKFWQNLGFVQLDRRVLGAGVKEGMYLVMSRTVHS